MVSGECNCGAIRYRVDANPSGVYVCHCSICRRFTGTHGNAVIVVRNDDFKWVSGQELISTWAKPGHDWQIWFCSVCGSQVPGNDSATMMFVPAGTITSGAKELKVIHHIWVDSKAPWDEIGDTGALHPEAFGS